jgi:hypothetical protein
MGYPLIIAYKGDEFARVNHDGVWSVQWDKVLNVRFESATLRNKAVIAFAVILLAAKDNFNTRPWAESEHAKDQWDKPTKVLDISESDPPDEPLASFSLRAESLAMAKINFDGSWSIRWDETDQVARQSTDNWKTVAIICFCRLLMAAQYRFWTTPWKDETDEDDE